MEKKAKAVESKKATKRSASFSLLEVIVIVIMTALVVGVSSSLIVYNNYNKINSNYGENDKEGIEKFIEAYNNILESYVEKVDGEDLIDEAIKAMYEHLGDPYTSYLDKETTEALEEQLNGEYHGIGVEISKEYNTGYILVIDVFEGSPADQAGLRPGDLITTVNGQNTAVKTAEEVSEIIKNSQSEDVKISYLRNEEEKTTTVVVKNVVIPSVQSENFDGVGYIYIETFSNTTYSQFKNALEELEKDNIKSLVIDVRDNTGGYLEAASKIAELFIEKGKVIYQLEKQGKIDRVHKDETDEKRNYDVAVLINSNSASASEILAAALKDSYGAKLIGKISYGKGTVQEKEMLENGEMLKYTTAYWLTPNGLKINNVGLIPDVEVELDDYEVYSYEVDTQLQKAIETVR